MLPSGNIAMPRWQVPWQPEPCSDPRTIVLTDSPSMMRGRLVRGLPPTWPAKDPADRVSVGVDFGPLVRQPIAQFDYVATGVAVLSASLSGSIVTYRVAGGVLGQAASIATTITLADGQQITRAAILPIASQGAVVVAEDPTLLVVNGRTLCIGGIPIRLFAAAGQIAVAGQSFAVSGTPIAVGAP